MAPHEGLQAPRGKLTVLVGALLKLVGMPALVGAPLTLVGLKAPQEGLLLSMAGQLAL